MILQLTTVCHENCSHCMIDANSNGTHMSEDTFGKVLTFFREYKPFPARSFPVPFLPIAPLPLGSLIISGGEPTEHPQFFEFMYELLDSDYYPCKGCSAIILATNGSFLRDKEKTRILRRLLKCNPILSVQISAHKRFYPNYDETVRLTREFISSLLPNCRTQVIGAFDFQGENGKIIPLGRGVNFMNETTSLPSCVNTLLAARQAFTFIEMQEILGTGGKVCRPLISATGTFHAGETHLCGEFGNLNDTPEELFDAMRRMKLCNKCGCIRNFSAKNMETLEKFDLLP